MKTPLALLLIVLSTLPAYAEPRTQPTLDPRALLHALEEAFTTVADRVTPAVVNVSTVPRKQSAEETPERFREFFGEEFYERSEEHTSELQSPCNLVCRLLLEKKKKITYNE